MKRLLVLSILLALGSSLVGTASIANAQKNPGEDPANDAGRSDGSKTEGNVPAKGIPCKACEASLVHVRLDANTNPSPKPTDSGGASEAADGTR